MADATGLALEGAEVTVVETGRSVFTGRGGTYRIAGLPPGDYTIAARFVGAEAVTQTVSLEAQEAVARLGFRVGLAQVFELERFEVTGTEIGQAKALSQRRAASNLTEVVASDAFGQFVDRNAAEALQRVAGISVQDNQGEGQFIIIRGADPALNSVAIDGVITATPEEDGRQTGLNIISLDQLERIEVTKTWLPNQWANFVGGAVNLVTRSALDREGAFGSVEAAWGQYDIADDASSRFRRHRTC